MHATQPRFRATARRLQSGHPPLRWPSACSSLRARRLTVLPLTCGWDCTQPRLLALPHPVRTIETPMTSYYYMFDMHAVRQYATGGSWNMQKRLQSTLVRTSGTIEVQEAHRMAGAGQEHMWQGNLPAAWGLVSAEARMSDRRRIPRTGRLKAIQRHHCRPCDQIKVHIRRVARAAAGRLCFANTLSTVGTFRDHVPLRGSAAHSR